MKFSFSTVGCPDWSWSEILAAARDLGYDGLELRSLGKELFLPGVSRFQPDRVEAARADLTARGLCVTCLDSDVLLSRPVDAQIERAKAWLGLACALHVPYIRVLGDEWGQPDSDVDEKRVAEGLRALAPLAVQSGVTLLVETNGVWADTGKLRRLLDDVGSPHVAVLWDVNHPVRYFGETPQKTWDNIGPWVKHVHLKDSVVKEDGRIVYKMLGYGDLPLAEILSLLKRGGYDGALSMEWVKRWNAELEDAGVVFPHFIYQVKKMWKAAE